MDAELCPLALLSSWDFRVLGSDFYQISFFFSLKFYLIPACECSVTQLCPTLCNPMDCSPPGSTVHGILRARILEWLPFPTPEDLLDSGIKPVSLVSPALIGRFFTAERPGKPIIFKEFPSIHTPNTVYLCLFPHSLSLQFIVKQFLLY